MTNKTPFELKHLVIPKFVYKDNKLNWTSARVYAFINSYTNPFYFTNEQLAKMFDCHPQTISTAMNQLEELKYIKTEYRVKSGGGKIRLSVNAHSDGAKSLIREKKVEATTERNRSEKVVKDNNIKGEFFEKTSKEQRPPKRTVFGGYPEKPTFIPKPQKKGTYAENIV